MELPKQFVDNLNGLFAEDEKLRFINAIGTESPVSIRLNRRKNRVELKDNWVPIPWCPSGYYLPDRPTFTFDPLFHAGGYYVQEASSMFLSLVVRTLIGKPVVALDLCAAPGGKSTLLRDELPEGSLLVANEIMPKRAQVLAENLIKWGHPDCVVTQSDSASFSSLYHVFDLILTDVPCSGEGMFRKDETAISEWSLDNVDLCWKRQRMIIENIWPALKPGGILVYSTCTYNVLENEQNIKWIHDTFGAEVLEMPIDPAWGITSSLGNVDLPVYRFLPHKTKGEGLFMAVLRKSEQDDGYGSAKGISKPKKKAKQFKARPIPCEVKKWLNDSSYDIRWNGDDLYAISSEFVELWKLLNDTMKVIHGGVLLATQKGKDLIPDHSLAMSLLYGDIFPKAEVSYEQAIAYCRKETICLDSATPKGFVLLTWKGLPLGWVKNIGNRANNLYPQEWRIRSGYMPEQILTL